MKYKVKDLLDAHNLISHLFLDCLGRDSNDLIESITKAEGYNVDTSEVEICLTFNGVEKDVERFINHLDEDFNTLVEKRVSRRMNELIPNINEEMFYEMQEKIGDIIDEYKGKLLPNLSDVKGC